MKVEKGTTETYRLLKEVYGNECLSRARVFEHFQDGREDVEDDSRPSKTDENIGKIGNMFRCDHLITIRAITETVEMKLTKNA